MAHLLSLGVVFVYFLLIISTCICEGNKEKDCKQLILATLNIGLEEKQATERTAPIINAILIVMLILLPYRKYGVVRRYCAPFIKL